MAGFVYVPDRWAYRFQIRISLGESVLEMHVNLNKEMVSRKHTKQPPPTKHHRTYLQWPPVRRNRLITHGKPSTVVCRTPPFGHTCEPRMPPYTTSKTRPGYAPQPGVLDTVQPQTTRSKLHQQQLRTQRTSQTNNQKAPHALPHLDGKQPVQQRNAPPPSTRR